MLVTKIYPSVQRAATGSRVSDAATVAFSTLATAPGMLWPFKSKVVAQSLALVFETK